METDRLAALIADLDHPDKPTIRAAVDQLIEAARESAQVRTALDRRLNEFGHRNYWPVAYILGHLPDPSGAAIRNLLDTLDHREPDIRWACSLLLAKIARSEIAVIELLIELCRTGTANQKRMALYSLRDLALNDPASLQAMLNSLSDSDATVRVAAVTSLKNRTEDTDRVRNALLQSYLIDADIKVRNAAAVTLAQMGSPSEEFLLALRQATQSDNSQARKAAATALELLERRGPAPIGSLRNR
jgi:HEAT repeat protein